MDFTSLKKATATVKTQVNTLREDLERLRREREFLETAPLPRSEVKRLLAEWIDQARAKYPKGLAIAIRHVMFSPNDTIGNRPVQLLTILPNTQTPDRVQQLSLLWCFADQIKQGINSAVDAMDWPEAGPPRAERASKLAELNDEIEKLEQQLADFIRDAALAGLDLTQAAPSKPQRQSKYTGGRPLGRYSDTAREKP